MSSLPSFNVRNLGPIEEGMVHLHPLTILIGKNNTGKTYMAQAIYAAYRSLGRVHGPAKPTITIDEAKWLISVLQENHERNTDILQGPLRGKARQWMNDRLLRASINLEDRLKAYFDLDELDDLTRWGSNSLVKLDVRAGTVVPPSSLFGVNHNLQEQMLSIPSVTPHDVVVKSRQKLYGVIESLLSEWVLVGSLSSDSSDLTFNSGDKVSLALSISIWEDFFLPSVSLDGSAHYLPAGRSGLLQYWTDVVHHRLELDQDPAPLGYKQPPLNGISVDFLIQLLKLRRSSRTRESTVGSIGTYLTDLIAGDIEPTYGHEDIPLLSYVQNGFRIPVQQASSMVAELAPLLRWIREVLEPGDVLLIDEPEAHMHPEAVLAVARTLVALARFGVRVVCTTHSSDFLHQVSNLILQSRKQREPSDDTLVIEADQVGVYRFYRPHPNSGVRIIRETIDPQWGIPEDEYVAVAERLTEETANLVDQLQ